ncbi:helix-turn-helix domain-containing protein [Microbacterium binotii]|uniref:helix-turn-helix domain-containing protein n=1 Tax=Microbacterium binotii TaxID=462710 RepID=UPI001F3DF15F|nr:helix-turn-helix transcriptional regulator [Microbacterium binotii]UIN30062.1 helix-turn-helix transcriptional regulator [Microbacterium binotii]
MTPDAATRAQPVSAYEAAVRALLSPLPGEPILTASDREALFAASALPPGIPGARFVVSAGTVIALLGSGRHGRAAETAAKLAAEADELRVHTAPSLLPDVYSAIGDGLLAVGETRRAHRFADAAARMAHEHGREASAYRAHGIAALALAMSGEHAAATDLVATASALADRYGWPRSETAYHLLLAHALRAEARGDAAELQTVAEEMRDSASDVRWLLSSWAVSAVAALLDGDSATAIAHSRQVTSTVAAGSAPPALRGFALGAHADALVLRGEPSRALAMLDGEASTMDHCVCLDGLRAGAYLHLGDLSAALRATAPCMRGAAHHSHRTLGRVLLTRALVFERLGRRDAARASLEDALSVWTDPREAFVSPLLPLREVAPVAAALVRRPALQERFAQILARADAGVRASVRAATPPLLLTRREREVAYALRTSSHATNAELAASLHVSVNTLKTQLKTLYAKVGAHERRGAVRMLESVGFYDVPFDAR